MWPARCDCVPMRVLVLGGTWFLGKRIVERLHARGDEMLLVHRGRSEPPSLAPVQHLHADRNALGEHAEILRRFAAQAVLNTCPFSASDMDTVLPVLPEDPLSCRPVRMCTKPLPAYAWAAANATPIAALAWRGYLTTRTS